MSEIPVHPQPSFYETTQVKVGRRKVDHKAIDAIRERPLWNFADATRRIRVKPALKKVPVKRARS